jgi:glycine/D-amino acid oxidase-like deaminating enzyme
MSRENRSLWFDHTEAKPYGKLVHDTEVDVAIVGGGLTGMTAALLLATAGRQVLLVEKASIGAGETGRTTAHLTEAIDSRFPQLRRNFGNDGARLAAQKLREHDGVVVLGVASAVDERQRGLARSSAELSQLLLLCGELLDVPLSELREAGGVVPKPAPQLRARGKLFRPLVETCVRARHSSRPEAVDQDAVAVGRRRRLVRPFQADAHEATLRFGLETR